MCVPRRKQRSHYTHMAETKKETSLSQPRKRAAQTARKPQPKTAAAKMPAALAVSALTLVMFETVVMVVVISTVEVSLRKLVHPHAQTESK